MKSTDFIVEGIGEDAHAMSVDHEVQMARSDCYHAAKYAIELHKMLQGVSEQEGLEGWIQEKITLACDYLRTVHEHLAHESAMNQELAMPSFTFENAEKQLAEGLKDPKDNPCWDDYEPVGTKKKNGKTVPNCVPKNESAEPEDEELFGQDATSGHYRAVKNMRRGGNEGGMSLMGYVVTDYATLEKVFGEPDWGPSEDSDDKVTCLWSITFGDDESTKATVYDWKTGGTPMGTHRWHVGGFEKKAVELVEAAIKIGGKSRDVSEADEWEEDTEKRERFLQYAKQKLIAAVRNRQVVQMGNLLSQQDNKIFGSPFINSDEKIGLGSINITHGEKYTQAIASIVQWLNSDTGMAQTAAVDSAVWATPEGKDFLERVYTDLRGMIDHSENERTKHAAALSGYQIQHLGGRLQSSGKGYAGSAKEHLTKEVSDILEIVNYEAAVKHNEALAERMREEDMAVWEALPYPMKVTIAASVGTTPDGFKAAVFGRTDSERISGYFGGKQQFDNPTQHDDDDEIKEEVKETASMDPMPEFYSGQEILWRPKFAKMVPVPVTVIAVAPGKLKIKLQSPRLIQTYGKDVIVVKVVDSDITPKKQVSEMTAGGTGAGGFATGPTGGGSFKKTTGVPKKIKNPVKRTNPQIGKGIY